MIKYPANLEFEALDYLINQSISLMEVVLSYFIIKKSENLGEGVLDQLINFPVSLNKVILRNKIIKKKYFLFKFLNYYLI